ncbi:hypothetical protein VDBG_08224 [Verticillium alfalfae VaMs.102]|uniref:Uncharacterized protein n=1 Tax=Verticillium alfalfae (strain VaMs.102 / ATCC MYA-4576 / FGSC 10136) TaxID=526221 RepID=C9SUK4_VERA1|nr:hypothetical protein VDBG_08224 [Verticillium alfalfae VaMs.102]EEY22113.1 hypothetical protein VDBG_08224 [Verticillium alfalfae VaMs.102]
MTAGYAACRSKTDSSSGVSDVPARSSVAAGTNVVKK